MYISTTLCVAVVQVQVEVSKRVSFVFPCIEIIDGGSVVLRSLSGASTQHRGRLCSSTAREHREKERARGGRGGWEEGERERERWLELEERGERRTEKGERRGERVKKEKSAHDG